MLSVDVNHCKPALGLLRGALRRRRGLARPPDAAETVFLVAETDVGKAGRLGGAGGRAAGARIRGPTAAAQHTLIARRRAARVGGGPVGRRALFLRGMAIVYG